jgi:uncharacterized protein
MAKSPTYLKQLRNELLAMGEDVMLLEELDGFLAGIVVCPETIPPSAWLPIVWGVEEAGEEPVFETVDHANRVIALVMGHYNHVARALSDASGHYVPLIIEDKRTGEIMWELWIEGFEKATKLRPTAWLPLLDADLEISQAFRGLLTLADVARRADHITELQRRELEPHGHELIGPWVLAINEWRMENFVPRGEKHSPIPVTHSPFGKVGRNDPCPCGSGKKYKKCCGLN